MKVFKIFYTDFTLISYLPIISLFKPLDYIYYFGKGNMSDSSFFSEFFSPIHKMKTIFFNYHFAHVNNMWYRS